MRVAIVGIGHVGLPTAAALAHIGHDVRAIDSDGAKVAMLGDGRSPFYEPGLDDLISEGVSGGRLKFSTEPAQVIGGAAVVFICVGTPPRASGEASLVAMERAAETIAAHSSGDVVVVQKSTVPTGTATRLGEHLSRYNPNVRFHVVSNPEFLREGHAVEDSLRPVRILVGGDSQLAFEVMRELYAPVVAEGAKWIETDVNTAELAKHASNAFLATKISFANALARVCELADADVVAVADAMGSDPRIGRAFLDAGLGYGGYCFPKDLASFERLSSRLGYDFGLLREVARVNEEAVESAFKKIEQELWNLEDKRIALLGLSFKPGTDDTRFAPSLELARRLIDAGAHVVGYDPEAAENARAEVPQLETVDDVYSALRDAHCAVVATEWDEFNDLDLEKTAELMAFPIIVDGRNVFDRAEMARHPFTYLSTGRPPVRPSRTERRGPEQGDQWA